MAWLCSTTVLSRGRHEVYEVCVFVLLLNRACRHGVCAGIRVIGVRAGGGVRGVDIVDVGVCDACVGVFFHKVYNLLTPNPCDL